MKAARSEQEFQNILRRLGLALDASRIGVWEHDTQSEEVIWDLQMHRLYGTGRKQKRVAAKVWMNAIHPDDLDQALADFDEAIARKGAYSSEYRIVLPGGEIRYLRSRADCFEEDGNLTFIGAEWDVTADVLLNRELQRQKAIAEARAVALEASTRRIEYAAEHDYLTGLPNRRFFDRHLAELAEHAGLEKLAILHIGLDRFKQVNDAAGHAVGDDVLKSSAKRIAAAVPRNSFIARVSGDEFAVLIADFSSLEDMKTRAERLAQQLKQSVWHNDEVLRIGASIGLAAASGRNVANLLAESDIALHRAKKLGRGRVEVFSAQMKAQLNNERRVGKQLARGLEKGEFIPYYQAQVDARTRRIVGMEVLARWRHPKRGLLLPAEFIEIAGNLGMLDDLDAAILKAALKDRRGWMQRGAHVPRIAVNVSAARLSDPLLIDELQQLDIEPDTLSFELLETIFLDDSEDGVLSNVAGLKAMGIDIEIDDFGSGHASIIGLMKLKPRRMKIDRQLVLPITTSREQKRLLRSIVDIAKALDIEVIAEGVETLEHAKLLTRLGCDILQGYAIAYPVSADDMLARLMEKQDLELVGEH
ncbi:putative bifunctional diguanylate cyclase/phosphodiesterase [Rhizobium herbae]|uniref:Diguanylate cyclase (GGDEF)-like protein n=1 Tax=Rhizobium herbae TaxID=508661 RepID=A0ABS4EHW4_9HYPH|nr:GGDEF domain-containing phosphodiesterase [Rhizobium herbae]MBP1857532.1 diguanylate cyclase (GGDEF)-like protein [Rhizobium herbae]